ncbi:hypothetical protein TSUD_369670 [Trifolium subterraneum]|uniref:Replication protein A 70 kDa DNA-binding subunit B/D first OB fold domain-containing protein n=1 Tax=Trifolium subterraneum TaxID=3900 RepID=A0A2Z6MXQ3_TRISU|nr:hypothetical protein TSUD_369670 [Trifolium subterraneum]
MSRAFDFIKDLNKERDIWKIVVRVIDSWTVVDINGHPHLEMVIADEKGGRVKVVTHFKEYEHWKSYIVDQKPSQSADEVSKHPSISKKDKDECSESLNFPTQSLSACGDNEFEEVSNNTPAKRPSAPVDDIASPSVGTTKLSSTKPTKHVKLE